MPKGVYKRDMSPEAHAQRSAIQKKAQNKPEARANNSASKKKFYEEHPGFQKEIYNRSEVQEKHLKAVNCSKAKEKGRAAKKKFYREHPGFQKEIQNRPEVRAKQSAAKVGDKNPTKRLEVRKKKRAAAIEYWADPENREKQLKAILKGCNVKPNKSERRLQKLLNKWFSKEYQINVNAEVMTLGGKIPDFVNVNGQKKIIEMNGNYWHGEVKTGRTKEEEEKQRIDYFAQFGWKTLIVWEHELRNTKKLKRKIKEYTNP